MNILMVRPRLLGALILLYLGLYKLWEFLIIVNGMRAIPDGRMVSEGLTAVSANALIVLYGLVLLSYGIGGAGLLLRRRWSAVVVFYSAIFEVTTLLAVLLYAPVIGLHRIVPHLSVFPSWLLLVFPAGFVFAARSLRKSPNLWQAPQESSANSMEALGQLQAGAIRPTLPREVFWIFIGTGLLLPALLGLIAMAVSLLQGEAFHTGEGSLFILPLGMLLGIPLFALPYIVLALIARPVLRRAFQQGGEKPLFRTFVFAGIYLGMTVFIVPAIYSLFGDPESLAVLILAPIAPLSLALPGIFVGAIFGLIAYSGWNFFRRQAKDSKQR